MGALPPPPERRRLATARASGGCQWRGVPVPLSVRRWPPGPPARRGHGPSMGNAVLQSGSGSDARARVRPGGADPTRNPRGAEAGRCDRDGRGLPLSAQAAGAEVAEVPANGGYVTGVLLRLTAPGPGTWGELLECQSDKAPLSLVRRY